MPCEAISMAVSLRVMATLDEKLAFENVERKYENVF